MRDPRNLKEVSASGEQALQLATQLLQRARLAHPHAGLWEAADVQWWWRAARDSDAVKKPFWLDADGPVAGVLLTSWKGGTWQCDPVVVPGVAGPDPVAVWERALELGTEHSTANFKVAVDDANELYRGLAERAGLVALEHDHTAWLSKADRPAAAQLPAGFSLVDRTQRLDAPHPMRHRNGEHVAERLAGCSLYDPALDLALESDDGRVAGYSLFWFDPVTKAGLVEPVRIDEEFQRRGLARAMLSEGIERLLAKGARRVKVSYFTDAAAALYQGLGFRPQSSTTWYGPASDA